MMDDGWVGLRARVRRERGVRASSAEARGNRVDIYTDVVDAGLAGDEPVRRAAVRERVQRVVCRVLHHSSRHGQGADAVAGWGGEVSRNAGNDAHGGGGGRRGGAVEGGHAGNTPTGALRGVENRHVRAGEEVLRRRKSRRGRAAAHEDRGGSHDGWFGDHGGVTDGSSKSSHAGGGETSGGDAEKVPERDERVRHHSQAGGRRGALDRIDAEHHA